MQQLSDEQMLAKTDEFRAGLRPAWRTSRMRRSATEAEQDVLDQILPEAFAVVREAGRRVTCATSMCS